MLRLRKCLIILDNLIKQAYSKRKDELLPGNNQRTETKKTLT